MSDDPAFTPVQVHTAVAPSGVEPIAADLWAEVCAMARTRENLLFDALWQLRWAAPAGSALPWRGRLDKVVASALGVERVTGLRRCLARLNVTAEELQKYGLTGRVLHILIKTLETSHLGKTLMHAPQIGVAALRLLDSFPHETMHPAILINLTDIEKYFQQPTLYKDLIDMTDHEQLTLKIEHYIGCFHDTTNHVVSQLDWFLRLFGLEAFEYIASAGNHASLTDFSMLLDLEVLPNYRHINIPGPSWSKTSITDSDGRIMKLDVLTEHKAFQLTRALMGTEIAYSSANFDEYVFVAGRCDLEVVTGLFVTPSHQDGKVRFFPKTSGDWYYRASEIMGCCNSAPDPVMANALLAAVGAVPDPVNLCYLVTRETMTPWFRNVLTMIGRQVDADDEYYDDDDDDTEVSNAASIIRPRAVRTFVRPEQDEASMFGFEGASATTGVRSSKKAAGEPGTRRSKSHIKARRALIRRLKQQRAR
jgi:hypothetical protein